MNFLKTTTGLAILAALLTVGTSTTVIYLRKDELVEAKYAPPKAPTALPVLWSFNYLEVDKLIHELKSEKKRLEERETEIDRANAQLSAEKAELLKLRKEIEAMRAELSQTIVEVQEGEYKNLKSLAQTYSALSPQASVAIISDMDETMAVKILSLMKADKVGAIFQEMTRVPDKDGTATLAKRAARLSDRLRLLKPLKKEESQL